MLLARDQKTAIFTFKKENNRSDIRIILQQQSLIINLSLFLVFQAEKLGHLP